jgi:hypothetical protein
MALFAADMIWQLREKPAAWALVGLLLVYQFWGIWQSVNRYPPGITTQFFEPTQIDHRYDAALMDFLRKHGETRGYGNYWVAYPLAFLSQEELIFTPRLPYHLDFRYTPRDNRYDPYNEMVETADRVAYITTNHTPLDQWIRERFTMLDVQWEEAEIGDYHLFFKLSRLVRPEEIGLGE